MENTITAEMFVKPDAHNARRYIEVFPEQGLIRIRTHVYGYGADEDGAMQSFDAATADCRLTLQDALLLGQYLTEVTNQRPDGNPEGQ